MPLLDTKCPVELQDNALNVKNHLKAIKDNGLGPADPTQSNDAFWKDKAKTWSIPVGDARGRLCANCEHYVNASFIQECIDKGPAKNIKASALPLEPKWVDIESKPTAFCTLLKITCSPLRTCDEQEPGGPVDDTKLKAIELGNVVSNDIDTDEFADLFKSSVEEEL